MIVSNPTWFTFATHCLAASGSNPHSRADIDSSPDAHAFTDAEPYPKPYPHAHAITDPGPNSYTKANAYTGSDPHTNLRTDTSTRGVA